MEVREYDNYKKLIKHRQNGYKEKTFYTAYKSTYQVYVKNYNFTKLFRCKIVSSAKHSLLFFSKDILDVLF